MKYQQLGIGWNDKKYDELGTIVKDCNKALNDILQIMLQAEKYVASLAKSVQEYDNVNLDTPSARNSFLQGLQTPNVGNSSYQYCLGVLTQGSTPDGYIAVISQRHENAEQNVREVFDHFAGKLMIQDSEYPPDQTAHYSPGNYIGHSRGVYYNAASDMTNPRGAGTTYFHELAHMIDHASCNYRSNLSNTPEFAEALVEDGQRILSLYNNLPVEKQTAFLTRIRQDSAHSFSDLIDATTNGQLHGNYGHSRNYWTRPGNLQAEAFAHFFEASMGDQGKLELLANFFPTAFGIFSSMIDSIRPDNHVRVLSRERLVHTMDKNKSVADFMNSFLNTPEPKIDNEYYEIEEQYFRQFGHGVPREMLPDSISTEQIKQAMKKCILSKKDNLFELLGIIINDNYLY